VSDALTPKTQEILDRGDADRAGLLASVAGLSREQLDFRPSAESWSIGEVLHHLALAHEATAKLMSIMVRRARDENVPRDPEPERSVLSAIDGVVPGVEEGKASAPDRVVPQSYLAPEEALARLEASSRRVVGAVETLSAFDLSSLRFPHPFFGELDAYQWLLVTGWHERRHTKQIERIRASAGFPES
jgi:hypothetical protein